MSPGQSSSQRMCPSPLARQEIDILGHHITADGASLILRHVQAIQDFPSDDEYDSYTKVGQGKG